MNKDSWIGLLTILFVVMAANYLAHRTEDRPTVAATVGPQTTEAYIKQNFPGAITL